MYRKSLIWLVLGAALVLLFAAFNKAQAGPLVTAYRANVVYRDPLSNVDADEYEAVLRFRLIYKCQATVLADTQSCALALVRDGFWESSTRFIAPGAVMRFDIETYTLIRR